MAIHGFDVVVGMSPEAQFHTFFQVSYGWWRIQIRLFHSQWVLIKKSSEDWRGHKVKGRFETSLSYAYEFNVHCFVGHFRRVHASNPQMKWRLQQVLGLGQRQWWRPLTHRLWMVLNIFITPKPRCMVIGSFGPSSKCWFRPAYPQYHHNGRADFHLGL